MTFHFWKTGLTENDYKIHFWNSVPYGFNDSLLKRLTRWFSPYGMDWGSFFSYVNFRRTSWHFELRYGKKCPKGKLPYQV